MQKFTAPFSLAVFSLCFSFLIFAGVFVLVSGGSLSSETPTHTLKSGSIKAYANQLADACAEKSTPEICSESLFFTVEYRPPIQYELGDPKLRDYLPIALLSRSDPASNERRPQPCNLQVYRSWVLEHVQLSKGSDEGVLFPFPPELNTCVGVSSRLLDPYLYYIGFYKGRVVARARRGTETAPDQGAISVQFFHHHTQWKSSFTSKQVGPFHEYAPILSDLVRGAWAQLLSRGYPALDSRDLPAEFIIHQFDNLQEGKD